MTPAEAQRQRYAARQETGVCPYGRDHGPPLPGKKACAACLKRHRHAMQRYLLRQKRLKHQGHQPRRTQERGTETPTGE